MSDAITPIVMPKWGLSMTEGTLTDWWVSVGDEIEAGDDLADIETTKITNCFESPAEGTVRALAAEAGDTVPVGALICVLAPEEVGDDEISAYVEEHKASFVPDEAAGDDGLERIILNLPAHQLAVVVAGDKDSSEIPAVLLHGFGGDAESWAGVLEPLSADRAVFVADLPGHGLTTKNVGDGSLDAMVEIVEQLVTSLEVGKVHLVGHSMGGAIAAAFAASHPGAVASVTLLCAAGVPGTQLNGDYINGFIDARRRKDLKPFAEMLFADSSLVTRDMLEGLIRFKRLDGVGECLTALRDGALAQAGQGGVDIAKISAPLLVIGGDADQIVGVPSVDGAQVLAGIGHMPQAEAPGQVAELVLQHWS